MTIGDGIVDDRCRDGDGQATQAGDWRYWWWWRWPITLTVMVEVVVVIDRRWYCDLVDDWRLVTALLLWWPYGDDGGNAVLKPRWPIVGIIIRDDRPDGDGGRDQARLDWRTLPIDGDVDVTIVGMVTVEAVMTIVGVDDVSIWPSCGWRWWLDLVKTVLNDTVVIGIVLLLWWLLLIGDGRRLIIVYNDHIVVTLIDDDYIVIRAVLIGWLVVLFRLIALTVLLSDDGGIVVLIVDGGDLIVGWPSIVVVECWHLNPVLMIIGIVVRYVVVDCWRYYIVICWPLVWWQRELFWWDDCVAIDGDGDDGRNDVVIRDPVKVWHCWPQLRWLLTGWDETYWLLVVNIVGDRWYIVDLLMTVMIT